MATNVTSTTFLSQYNDDYRDSDHYHRILFNNGRALQARELTQMQTIIQSEMARMASFIFKEAGIFGSAGSLSGAFAPLGSVRVTALPSAGADNIAPQELVGLTVTNADNIAAIIKAVIPGTGGADDVILVKYTTSNLLTSTDTSASPRIFAATETLDYTHPTEGAKTLTIKANSGSDFAINKGSHIETPAFNTFVAGHLITVEQQSLVLDKFSDKPSTTVGFVLSEQIITAEDNIALYDNSGATPNLTSPGADRLKITLTLKKESDKAAGETFYPLVKVVNGIARIIQTADNALGELGRLLASRTDDITGDFVVNDAPQGTFRLNITKDSDDAYLQYRISGGIAFVGGNRIERGSQNPPIRIAKPRSTTTPSDLDVKTNEYITARYGNYFLADSLNGLVGTLDSFGEVGIYNGANLGGAQIGTVRLRNIDEFDNKFRLHVFDLDMDSNAGTEYSLRDAKSIGFGANHFANLAEIDGNVSLQDKEFNSLLFPVGRKRVWEINDVTLTRQRIDRKTVVGGTATFEVSGDADNFVDAEQWIVQIDSSGEIFSPPSISGSLTTQATIVGLPNGAATLLGYEEINTASRKTKTLRTGGGTAVASTSVSGATQSVLVYDDVTPDSTGRFKLHKGDIYLFRSVVDNVTSEDITYKYVLDNGQRDNFYTMGGGILRKGYSAPTGTIRVTYDYFYHTSGAFFGGRRSYPDLTYTKIPTYVTSAGEEHKLSDVIDMRPLKDSAGDFTGPWADLLPIPRNGDLIKAGSISYWMPRIDRISLKPNGYINVTQGKSNNVPNAKIISEEEMLLYDVRLFPYTMNEKDLQIESYDNRGFKMADLRNINTRLKNVEELAALTISEMELNKQEIADPNDATLPDRIKLGITGDTFNSNLQSDMGDVDYRARIDKNNNFVGPLVFGRTLPMFWDSANSEGVVRKGNTIWPSYTEEVMINQNVASKAINVNQFELNKYIGTGVVEPPRDAWNVRKLVDANYEGGPNTSFAEVGTQTASSQGNENTDGGWG